MADENTVGSRLTLRPEEPEVKTARIPLPPQLKADEEQLREAEHAAEAVGQAALLQHARKGANRPAPSTRAVPPILETVIAAAKQKKNASPQKCTACQTPIALENAEFSFCTHCGADLPKASLSLETAPLAEAKPQRLSGTARGPQIDPSQSTGLAAPTPTLRRRATATTPSYLWCFFSGLAELNPPRMRPCWLTCSGHVLALDASSRPSASRRCGRRARGGSSPARSPPKGRDP